MAWLKLAIGVLLFGLATATPTRNLQRERVDTFRTIAAFPKAVAISTSTNDTSFKCMSAVRTNYDAEAKTASYVWLLRGQGGNQRRNVTFTITAGTIPDQANYTVDGDNSRVYTGYTHYTDFQNCLITTITYRDHDRIIARIRPRLCARRCARSYEQEYLQRVGIRHVRTAPYHPSSNGLAERFVQTLKAALRKSSRSTSPSDLADFLLAYRNTPQATTAEAPSVLLLGRRLRTRLDLVRPSVNDTVAHKQFPGSQSPYTSREHVPRR
ncbi:hypothetical protein MTO96_036141 [Rhipicephalus appendiculatus]